MVRVARYVSMVRAQHAAMHLRENGIEAQVVGDHVQDVMISPLKAPFEVMIGAKGELERARALVDSYEASVREEDPPAEIEDGAWRPDISALDPAVYAVDCDACGSPLPMDSTLESCPSCGAYVDVVERIVERYGPEALDAADEPELDDSVITTFERCRFCKASLRGLPRRGNCPACGSLYAVDLP